MLAADNTIGSEMTGLREQQKIARRAAISKAALELFESQGYQATTLEQIARIAGVSVPTVFVYFSNKQEIFLERVREADHRAILAVRDEVSRLDNPVEALCQLETSIVRHAFSMLPAVLWKELMPSLVGSLGQEGSGLPAAYRQVNSFLIVEMENILSSFQSRGQLRSELDVGMVASLLSDYAHLQFLRLVNQAKPDFDAHTRDVRRVVELVFRGMEIR